MQDRVFHMLLGDKYFIWNILMPPLFTNKQLVRDHVLVIVLVPCRALGTVQIKWRSVNVTPSWSSSQVQRSSWWHHVLWKRHVAVTIHWPSVKLTVTLRRTVKERHKLEAHGVPFPTTARFLSSPLGGSHPFPTNLTDIKKSASLAFDFVFFCYLVLVSHIYISRDYHNNWCIRHAKRYFNMYMSSFSTGRCALCIHSMCMTLKILSS